jgi:hypothetical protein
MRRCSWSHLLSYLTIARVSGEPDRLLDDYRRSSGLMDQVGHDHGLILHAGAPSADIVNLWPSRERSEAAAADSRRLAALADTSVSPAAFRREHYTVERYVLSP